MKKDILFYILLLFLIVVNVFFLVNYLGKPNHDKARGKQDDFIVRELKFDDAQKQKFEALKTEHFKNIEKILDNERKLKDDLFDRISNDTIDESQVDLITNRIADIVKARELETFYHFREIQEICNDKQKAKFKQIVKQALHGKSLNGPGEPPRDRMPGDAPPPRH